MLLSMRADQPAAVRNDRRLRSIVSGLLFTMGSATATCRALSARSGRAPQRPYGSAMPDQDGGHSRLIHAFTNCLASACETPDMRNLRNLYFLLPPGTRNCPADGHHRR